MVSDLFSQDIKCFENERLLSLFIPSQLLVIPYQNPTQQTSFGHSPLFSPRAVKAYTQRIDFPHMNKTWKTQYRTRVWEGRRVCGGAKIKLAGGGRVSGIKDLLRLSRESA